MDEEMGRKDKLFFMVEEGKKKGGRLYLSFDYLFLAASYRGLLSAECIRNVTGENGWRRSRRDGGRARGLSESGSKCYRRWW